MQDDLTGATSTPAEDNGVRADLEAALGDWDKTPEPEKTDVSTDVVEHWSSAQKRDPQGRWKASDAPEKTEEEVRANWDAQTEQPKEPEAPVVAAEPEPEAKTEPETIVIEGSPPPGWSVQSKAAWDALPAHIRADIVKRETEVNNGFAKLRDYKGIDRYAEMAKRSGTTLETALERYVGMENLLRTDPQKGLLAVAHNMGINPQQLHQWFGGGNASAQPQPYQNGQGNGYQAPPSQNDYDDPYVRAAVSAALQPVTQELGSLKDFLRGQQTANQERQVSEAQKVIDEFSALPENRYFSDVEGIINNLLEKGMVERTGNFRADLANAYQQACQLHPEVREAIFNDRLSKTEEKRKADAAKAEAERRAKAEAAQRAAVSVTGAPSGNPASTPSGSRGSVRDDLLAAWDGAL